MATHPPIAVRSVVALATSFALLLPLPARCAPCSAGNDHCPHVAESLRDSDSNEKAHICCQRHTTINSTPTATAAPHSVHQNLHTCGCVVRPAPRTTPLVEKFTASPELVAGLPSAAYAPSSLTAATAPTGVTSLPTPPPIPHRILHCSLII
jgi:hypothetical protein